MKQYQYNEKKELIIKLDRNVAIEAFEREGKQPPNNKELLALLEMAVADKIEEFEEELTGWIAMWITSDYY